MSVLRDRSASQRGWSLSLKLAAANSLLILLVAGILATGLYVQLRRVQRRAIRARLRDIVSLAQPQIDSDFHALLVAPDDASSSYYRILQQRLAAIQQTSDDILRLSTLRERPNGDLTRVLDYAPPPAEPAPIGSPVTDAHPLLASGTAAIDAPTVERQLQRSSQGRIVLQGYAPIVDPLGRQEGILAIELDASEILASEARARRRALLVFVVVLPLALGVGYWLTQRLTAPIGALVDGVERIAAGDLSHRVQARSQDEIGLLATRFNDMSDRLQASFAALEAKIAERQQALDRLQEAQSQLVHAEKMVGLGQMVAGIAHEINNPVGFIHSNLYYVEEYSQLLLAIADRCQPSSSEASELEFIASDFPKILASMQAGTQRIRDIVRALRNFSRLHAATLRWVDLRAELDNLLPIVQHRLHAEGDSPPIEIVRDYAELPRVECYPDQINQTVLNLLVNAIDALRESQTPNPTIWLRLQPRPDDWVRLVVADNGPGMTAEVQQQIFNPFFTTKPVGCGTGLGLAVSYSIIVDQHGGAIACHSTPGNGSSFSLDIPHRQTPPSPLV